MPTKAGALHQIVKRVWRPRSIPGAMITACSLSWGIAGHASTMQSVLLWLSAIKPHLQTAWNHAAEVSPIWYQLLLLVIGLGWIAIVASRPERGEDSQTSKPKMDLPTLAQAGVGDLPPVGQPIVAVHRQPFGALPEPKPYRCKKCDRAFKVQMDLLTVGIDRVGPPQIKCPFCGNIDPWRNGL